MKQGGHILWCPFLAASQVQWDMWTPVFGTLRLMCYWQQVSAGGPELKHILPPFSGNSPLHRDPRCLFEPGLKWWEMSAPCGQPAGKLMSLPEGPIGKFSVNIESLFYDTGKKIKHPTPLHPRNAFAQEMQSIRIIFFLSFSSCLCITLVIHQDREIELRSFVIVG